MTQITQMESKLIYKELTHDLIGALFKVYNSLGFGYQEKEYQKALAAELDFLGIKYQRELYSNLKYRDKLIRGFYVDFLVDGKIILELKVGREIYPRYTQQVLQYLKNNNLRLGLIGVISTKGVLIKRVIN